MYFRSVNRGVTFTKAGFYTTGFVVLLGLVASGSGYNGLFLAVGFGLSVLTISGLLSERIMRFYDLTALQETIAESGTPFGVRMVARNSSPSWSVFAMENLVFTAPPRARLMPHVLRGLMESRLLVLGPGSQTEVAGSCQGLPRGLHREFTVMQRTLYPFGLLLKFKMAKVSTRIIVLPARDEALARRLALELRSRLAGVAVEQEFRCHRAMNPRDSLRLVDWKKSAGLPTSSWAIKVFEAPTPEYGIAIDMDWEALALSSSEAEYESWLSSARTACDVARELERKVVLRAPGGGWVAGYGECVELLAAAPRHSDRRKDGERRTGAEREPGEYVTLVVTAGGCNVQGRAAG